MTYFFKIKEPSKFRATLLQTARDSLVLLKNISVAEEVKIKKFKLLEEIQLEVDKLNELFVKLDELLLNDDFKKEFAVSIDDIKKEVEHKVSVRRKESQKIEEPASEIDRLEYTLNKIEKRLESLK